MKKLRLSSEFNLCYRGNLDINEYVRKGLTFFKELGFDCANLPTYWLSLDNGEWKEQAEQILIDSESIGIAFDSVHLPFLSGGVSQSKDFMKVFNQRMYASIDAAKMLGVKYAVLHPNTATLSPQKYKEEREHKKVVEHIAPYVDYANKIGVVLLIENMRTAADVPNGHRYCQSPNELCAVADELGIDVCWDFGHANISGVKQSEALTYIGKRLKHIHVNDNLGIKDDHLLPFMGNVDWRDAMHGLSLAEYDGTFMMELGVSKIPESMRVEYAKCVVAASNELLNYIV